jgi:arylsulfatase A-like enzyme
MNSIVLLTVDCLRRDHVGCYGYDRPTTPYIDEFSENSIRFKGYANCPGTRWAFQTLHTGAFHNRIDGLGIPEDYDSLAHLLKRAGYTTAGFIDNGWVSRDYGYDSGFDKFYSIRDTNSQAPLFKRFGVKMSSLLGGSVTHRVLKPIHDRWMAKQGDEDGFKPPHSDADTVDEVLEWLDMRSEPYFLWVHFMNAHTPYGYWPDHLEAIRGDPDINHTIHPGKDGLVKKGNEPPQRVIDTYDAGIRYVDQQIGRVLNSVEDSATTVITADHGEEFGKFGGFHEANLHHTMTDVPLIVKNAEIDENREGEVAQHLDIPPTLLTACGVEVPDQWDGVALQTATRNGTDAIFFTLEDGERAIQSGEWKLIQKSDDEIALWEQTNQSEIERPLERGPTENLSESLCDFWQGVSTLSSGRNEADVSQATRENLETLGYRE